MIRYYYMIWYSDTLRWCNMIQWFNTIWYIYTMMRYNMIQWYGVMIQYDTMIQNDMIQLYVDTIWYNDVIRCYDATCWWPSSISTGVNGGHLSPLICGWSLCTVQPALMMIRITIHLTPPSVSRLQMCHRTRELLRKHPEFLLLVLII